VSSPPAASWNEARQHAPPYTRGERAEGLVVRCGCPIYVIWVTHMKTTVEISDPLLRRAKQLAARRGTTVWAIIEDGLRVVLEAERARREVEPIRTHTFGGHGLQPGLTWDDWDDIRSRSYEGRGG
jgi:hypothetical protein